MRLGFDRLITGLLLSGMILCGCASGAPLAAVEIKPTLVEPGKLPMQPGPTSVPTAAPIGSSLKVWLSPDLPEQIKKDAGNIQGAIVVDEAAQADLKVEITPLTLGKRGSKAERPVGGYWVYALVTPFSGRMMEASLSELQEAWRTGTVGKELWMSPETRAVLSAWWGEAGSGALHIEGSDKLLEAAWQAGAAWGIVPFEELQPRWRVLRVDRQSPFDPEFRVDDYPLAVPVRLTGLSTTSPEFVLTNYDRSKVTVLAISGVTAIARRTAALINQKGVLYPASTIGGWLSEADLTHISNEVSFNQACPPEKAAVGEALFCSSPDYIRLLDAVGTDIVELTGNHNLDRGAEAYSYTLDLYHQRGWITYGGGSDLAEAVEPKLVENHGNRLAFVGCNMAGPEIAWAGKDKPGAATCDFDALEAQVTSLRGSGYLPVVTLQAFETEDYSPAPMQRPTEFVRLAEAGAVVVSGSQAHVPQGFQFAGDGLIHFGLGNLFFDQTDSLLTRRAFIDRHIFYDGRYLGVELFPITLEEYGRPEPMRPDERELFLETIFHASGW
jgi:hypothetical protein